MQQGPYGQPHPQQMQQPGYGNPMGPPPKKGMSGGKIAAIVGIAFVGGCGLLITVAALKNPVAAPVASATVAAPALAVPDDDPPAKPKPARSPGLKEAFKLGEFTYAVMGVKVVDEVGKGFAKKQASEGAAYVLVDFVIRNDGNETETVLTDDFRIVDAKGHEFRPSSDANTALAMSGGKDLMVSELQPGLKKPITTAFEMPESAAKGTFTLVIPEKGLLGTEAVRITLK